MKKIFTIFLLSSLLGWSNYATAQYTKLLDFAGTTNGSNPNGSLVSDGTFLYGMTTFGGTNNKGTVFKIMPDGTGYVKLMDLNGFISGSYPVGSLITDGTFLYGMTKEGGANNKGCIFKMMFDATGWTKLLDFDALPNGSYPYGSLMYDGTFLYGMTYNGGTSDIGTLFKIMPNGTGFVKLMDFIGSINGSYPLGSIVSDGTFLYGMTTYGGTNDLGTVFKIMPNGTGYVKLLDFAGATNGQYPYSSLMYDGTFLYGMTYSGGANGLGTIFKIMPDGTGYVKLVDFAGATNGSYPLSALVSDGTFLYGTTQTGGGNDLGTMFRMTSAGTGFTKLIEFSGIADGSIPYNSLNFDGTSFYGMTRNGGTAALGVIYKYGIATAIDENTAEANTIVYPNPTSGIFTCKTSSANSEIEVFNMLGEKIYAKRLNSEKTEINLSDKPKGIYFYRLIEGNNILNAGKIIVE